jgi:uncharacterized membrane protein YedE/YeeE
MSETPGAGDAVQEMSPLLPWWAVGITLAVLELAVFVVEDRGIGASTAYAHIAGLVWPTLRNPSWAAIAKAASWEEWFLAGGFLGAWVMARLRARGRGAVRSVPPSPARTAAAFGGGFLLILGARLAGGCTSGHILTGGVQLAASSLWFAFFTILAGVLAIRLLRRPAVR